MNWIEFIAALLAFFLTHSLPIRPPLRPLIEARLGRRGFSIAYSLLSTGVLLWLLLAAGRAPFVQIWPFAIWQWAVPQIAMVLVCLILCFALRRPNPLSFGGSRGTFDPSDPGILRWMRHPLLIALAIWSGAHLVPNGDLSHIIVFGLFFGFSLMGQRIIDRRKKREMGEAWQGLVDQIAATPLIPRFNTRDVLIRIGCAAGLYLFLLEFHRIFGIYPSPF